MAAEIQTIRQQIHALQHFRRWERKNELQFLPQLMDGDETVRALTSVLYMERKWLFVITDRKLIFLYRKIINGFQQTVPLSDINSVSCVKGLMFAKLRIVTGKGEMVLESILKKDALLIHDILSGTIQGM
jgi:hypothetical protein